MHLVAIWATTHVLSHELGHCLGLYHTFHGSCLETTNACPELVDGSNCTTCGDFLCDTPADPTRIFWDQDDITCQWGGDVCNQGSLTDANGDTYNPDEAIIMAYSKPHCMQYFTNGQGVRMRDIIANSTILQNATVPEDLVFQSQTLNFTALYAVSNTITADNITVPGGANITFVAGQEIIITNSVIEGEFLAYIDNQFCSVIDNINSARYAQGNDPENNEKVSFIELKNTIQDSYLQNYPNPFSFETNFHYFVEKPGAVSLTIYCIHGNKISTLVDETQHPKGAFSIPFNREDLPNGIYLCNLKTEKYNIIQKIMIVK